MGVGINLRDCVLVVFLSFPAEASLTALYRGLEACACREVFVLSSRRREGEVRGLADGLNDVLGGLGVRVTALPYIPDVDSAPEGIPGVARWFREEFLRRYVRVKGGRWRTLCLMISAGSRLEVGVASTCLERGSSNVAYVAFLWGPWRGAHYPYTPKPLEPLAGIHCRDTVCGDLSGAAGLGVRVVDAARKASPLPKGLTSLRRAALEAQALINAESPIARNPCVLTTDRGGRGCPGGCGPLSIEVRVGGRAVLRTLISDYCSWDDVVEGVADLAKQYVGLREEGRLSRVEDSALSTILDLAGVRQLRVAEATDRLNCGLASMKGHALIEALHTLPEGFSGVLDTNTLYKGIHAQALDYGVGNPPRVAVPACAIIELYEHVTQVEHVCLNHDRGYGVFRAGVAKLVAEEAKHLTPVMVREAHVKPCEVGVALAASTRTDLVPVTADRAAYENLLKEEGRIPASVLAEPAPITEVKFSERGASRRVAYSYYAIAQLKALSKTLRRGLRAVKAEINVKIVRED